MQHFVSILNTFHVSDLFSGREGRFPALAALSHSCSLRANTRETRLHMPYPPPRNPTTSSFVTLDNSALGTGITCVGFWEINWNAHRGDTACPHFSSSPSQTVCHVSKLEWELGVITQPRHPRGHLTGALSGFDFADDFAFVDVRQARSGLPASRPHGAGLPAHPSATNQYYIQKSTRGGRETTTDSSPLFSATLAGCTRYSPTRGDVLSRESRGRPKHLDNGFVDSAPTLIPAICCHPAPSWAPT